jgi:hypothetical protein
MDDASSDAQASPSPWLRPAESPPDGWALTAAGTEQAAADGTTFEENPRTSDGVASAAGASASDFFSLVYGQKWAQGSNSAMPPPPLPKSAGSAARGNGEGGGGGRLPGRSAGMTQAGGTAAGWRKPLRVKHWHKGQVLALSTGARHKSRVIL